MEFIIRRDICKEFLDKYNKDIYPELLSRIIEIGILTLKLSFKKLTFSPIELDEIINSLNEQNKRENFLRLKKLKKNIKKLKKLTNKHFKLESLEKDKKIQDNISTINNTFSFDDNIYDKIYINNTNFYDSNYYIPSSKTLRNRQLYQKRLENPLFKTQNKNVYPFWWWNLPESDSDNDEVNPYSQSRSINNESLSKSSRFDEAKIFQRSSNNNDINFYNSFNENSSSKDFGYFNNSNYNNYKISYDRNLNVIGVEKSGNKGKNLTKPKNFPIKGNY